MVKIIKKFIYDEKIKYLFWGAMTTLIYFIARFLSMLLTKSNMIPVAIAQVISIIFAFFVNKYFVFNHGSQSKSLKSQALIFAFGRIASAGLDFLLTFIMISKYYRFFIRLFGLVKINYQLLLFRLPIINKLIGTPVLLESVISAIIIQIVIIVINFFLSKYWAFK